MLLKTIYIYSTVSYNLCILYNRSCVYNHPCKKICYMDCGECTVPLMKELPCGHQLTLPCFVDILTYPCAEMVGLTNTNFKL